MATKLYVGNLSFNTTETDLQDLFATVGPVQEVIIMQDRMTMKSRGFGFVTMVEAADAGKQRSLNTTANRSRAARSRSTKPVRRKIAAAVAAATAVAAAVAASVPTAAAAAGAAATAAVISAVNNVLAVQTQL